MSRAHSPGLRLRPRRAHARFRRTADRHTGPHVPPHRAAGSPAGAGGPACAVSFRPVVLLPPPVVPARPAPSPRSALRDRRAAAPVAPSRCAASRRRRRTARATASPGAASIARCAAPVPAGRCAPLAVRMPGVPIRMPAVPVRPCVPPRVAATGRVTRSSYAAVLRGRAVLTCANLPIPIRVAPSTFLLSAHIFNPPSPDARCAPACASQYLPAASTVVPMSAIPYRPSPAAR